MADNKISLPSGGGGLVRFDEDYSTKFPLKPTHVVGFIILVIALRIGLSMIF